MMEANDSIACLGILHRRSVISSASIPFPGVSATPSLPPNVDEQMVRLWCIPSWCELRQIYHPNVHKRLLTMFGSLDVMLGIAVQTIILGDEEEFDRVLSTIMETISTSTLLIATSQSLAVLCWWRMYVSNRNDRMKHSAMQMAIVQRIPLLRYENDGVGVCELLQHFPEIPSSMFSLPSREVSLPLASSTIILFRGYPQLIKTVTRQDPTDAKEDVFVPETPPSSPSQSVQAALAEKEKENEVQAPSMKKEKENEKEKEVEPAVSEEHTERTDNQLESQLLGLSSAADKPIYQHNDLLNGRSLDEWTHAFKLLYNRMNERPSIVHIRLGSILLFASQFAVISSYTDTKDTNMQQPIRQFLHELRLERFVTAANPVPEGVVHHKYANTVFPHVLKNELAGITWGSNLLLYMLYSLPYGKDQVKFSNVSIGMTAWQTANTTEVLHQHVEQIQPVACDVNPNQIMKAVHDVIFAWCLPGFELFGMECVSWKSLLVEYICSRIVPGRTLKDILSQNAADSKRYDVNVMCQYKEISAIKKVTGMLNGISNDAADRLCTLFSPSHLSSGLTAIYVGMNALNNVQLPHVPTRTQKKTRENLTKQSPNEYLFGQLFLATLMTFRQNYQDTKQHPLRKKQKIRSNKEDEKDQDVLPESARKTETVEVEKAAAPPREQPVVEKPATAATIATLMKPAAAAASATTTAAAAEDDLFAAWDGSIPPAIKPSLDSYAKMMEEQNNDQLDFTSRIQTPRTYNQADNNYSGFQRGNRKTRVYGSKITSSTIAARAPIGAAAAALSVYP